MKIGWVMRDDQYPLQTCSVVNYFGRTLITANQVVRFEGRCGRIELGKTGDSRSVDGTDMESIRFDTPTGAVFDPTNPSVCYVIDSGSNTIRKIEFPEPTGD